MTTNSVNNNRQYKQVEIEDMPMPINDGNKNHRHGKASVHADADDDGSNQSTYVVLGLMDSMGSFQIDMAYDSDDTYEDGKDGIRLSAIDLNGSFREEDGGDECGGECDDDRGGRGGEFQEDNNDDYSSCSELAAYRNYMLGPAAADTDGNEEGTTATMCVSLRNFLAEGALQDGYPCCGSAVRRMIPAPWRRRLTLLCLLGIMSLSAVTIHAYLTSSDVVDLAVDGGGVASGPGSAVEVEIDEATMQILATASSMHDLRDGSSPQGRAAAWLAKTTTTTMTINGGGGEVPSSPEHHQPNNEYDGDAATVGEGAGEDDYLYDRVAVPGITVGSSPSGGDEAEAEAEARQLLLERYALATFYFSTGGGGPCEVPGTADRESSTSGGDRRDDESEGGCWRGATNWISADQSICGWYGVTCNESGRIAELQLSGLGLRGTIPGELALLQDIEAMDLSTNHLSGELPSGAIASLGKLSQLRVQENDLVGTVPPAVCGHDGDGDGGGAGHRFVVFSADCEGSMPEVQCSCCTECFYEAAAASVP